MDNQKLVELLQASLVPDTLRVIQATADLQKNYHSKPECVPALIEIATTHSDSTIRQQAAVFAARQVPRHWDKIEGSVDKDAIRKHLLQSTLNEQTTLARHSLSRVIAAIAGVDLPKQQWPELLPGIVSECRSSSVANREVCSFILFAILEDDPTHVLNDLHGLFDLLQVLIKDGESSHVCINAMQITSCFLDVIHPDEDTKSLQAIRTLIPSMVDVLKDVIVAQDDEKVKVAFEIIQSLLFYESAIVSNHLVDLVLFMVELGANTEADDEIRIMAITFLNQAVRYRRMKIQSMRNVAGAPDMGSLLTIKSMEIVAEIDDDEDDDDITPGRSALGLIDQLAADLPPRQVIVPLLNKLPEYSKSENAAFRRAGILSLGTCVEGAPDFVSTQLPTILPILMTLLNDSDVTVRSAALVGLTRIAEEMSEALAPYHKDLMSVVIQNLEFAKNNTTLPTPDTAQKKNIAVIRIVCTALDSVVEGLDTKDMSAYAQELISQIAPLLSHRDSKIKAAASSALGAIAQSVGKDFEPYFQHSIQALAPFIVIKDTEEDMDLRSSVCDSMGRFATAVGPETFKPYLNDLMLASEEGLHLDSSRLKETSFILWSSLAKVYEGQFAHYLPGVMKGLFDSLELDEEEISIAVDEASELLHTQEAVVSQGRRLKVKVVKEEDEMEEDNEEGEFTAISAQALEKEIAVEVLGDVITHACDSTQVGNYLEKSIEMVAPLVEHAYEGIRKSSIGCLYRCYARLTQLTEETAGRTWESNPPLQSTDAMKKLGSIVTQATTAIWEEEMDRNVVAEINRNLSAVLKTCGPAILTENPKFFDHILQVMTLILNRNHTSQQDFGEGEDVDAPQQGTSEYDWVTIDTALDVLIALSVVLKGDAIKVWQLFEKQILKVAVSDESNERSIAVGVIAEMTAHIGAEITPFTEKILKNVLRRLSDQDLETRSNAAYATGQLILHSTASNVYLPSYPTVLQKLENMLSITEARVRDNAAGCLCRMVMAHPEQVPLSDVLPPLVALLPLKEDYEENAPVYKCIFGLYERSEPTIQSLTPQLVLVFEQVLGPPSSQLNADTRSTVCALVAELYKAQPNLFASHAKVLQLAGLS
ncbi:uncharacterized protein MKZ38_006962 [Zalerion maritima]|uniref:Importin N-terminal domain-containing protein n=1 Tax=Zalerion maritima TaxID=339359 RepID=A0AAD5RN55_9PEZI|nr:uncharacterized protein MKZ38_006962 [Zalerion maritima]